MIEFYLYQYLLKAFGRISLLCLLSEISFEFIICQLYFASLLLYINTPISLSYIISYESSVKSAHLIGFITKLTDVNFTLISSYICCSLVNSFTDMIMQSA